MWKRLLSGLSVLVLAACNLNMAPGTTNETITGPPQVQIMSPLPNATYLENVAVNIQVLVSNAGADIDRVEFAVDDTIIATATAPNEAGVPSFSVEQSWQAQAAGTHQISVTAFRGDGSSSAPASVSVSVVAQVGQPQDNTANGNSTSVPTPQPSTAPSNNSNQQIQQPTATPTTPAAPTNTPQPTDSPTPNVPMATFLTGANVRSGPSTLFNPPLGGFAANDSTEVLAVNTAHDWYKVRYYNAEGWVYANLASISGNADSLPIDDGPPIPTLTFTPVPPTATPNINVNLVAGNVTFDRSDITCGETFKVYVDIANFGETRSPGGSLDVVDTSNGLETRTQGVFGEIDPGQTINVGPIPLTVSTNFSTEHVLAVIIDPGNAISETNEGDNRGEKKYTLKKGGC